MLKLDKMKENRLQPLTLALLRHLGSQVAASAIAASSLQTYSAQMALNSSTKRNMKVERKNLLQYRCRKKTQLIAEKVS